MIFFFLILDKSVLKIFNLIDSTDSKYPAFFNFCSAALSWASETDGKRTQIKVTLQRAIFIKIVPSEGGGIREVRNQKQGLGLFGFNEMRKILCKLYTQSKCIDDTVFICQSRTPSCNCIIAFSGRREKWSI